MQGLKIMTMITISQQQSLQDANNLNKLVNKEI